MRAIHACMTCLVCERVSDDGACMLNETGSSRPVGAAGGVPVAVRGAGAKPCRCRMLGSCRAGGSCSRPSSDTGSAQARRPACCCSYRCSAARRCGAAVTSEHAAAGVPARDAPAHGCGFCMRAGNVESEQEECMRKCRFRASVSECEAIK